MAWTGPRWGSGQAPAAPEPAGAASKLPRSSPHSEQLTAARRRRRRRSCRPGQDPGRGGRSASSSASPRSSSTYQQGFQLLAGRLHHHLPDALGLQPVGQRLQARGEPRVGADLLAATPATPTGAGRVRDADGRPHLVLADLGRRGPFHEQPRPPATSMPDRLCWWRPAGPTEETMLTGVLAATRSWCREGPRINLRHGLARTNERRAWPGVAMLIRRGGQRPWDLRRLRVERRANGEASSVMASAEADAGWCGRRQRWSSSAQWTDLGWSPRSVASHRVV
jgi:hypothetical protein